MKGRYVMEIKGIEIIKEIEIRIMLFITKVKEISMQL
jgi:hypothetical protein